MKLYRYTDERSSDSFYIYLHEFKVIRETRCGYVIDGFGKEKFVLRGNGKRFAYPTIELAQESFTRRKQHQLAILAGQHDHVKRVLDALKAGTAFSLQKHYNYFDFDKEFTG